MFRPISLNNENQCKLILMKNRKEELCEIDVKYIDSVQFKVKEYAKMTITIPSHITRNMETVPLPLYDLVRGKMQLVLEINSTKYKFIIEEISEKETKDVSTKTLTCYEWQYTLQKLNFMIGDAVITRQLYRGDNQLETSDGVLDMFEQYCTGWSVAYVDQKAKQELTLCSPSERIEMYTNLVVASVNDKNWLFDKEVSVNIGEKPLNFSISWDCEIYDSNDKLYLSATSTHEFGNLPYAIKRIGAKHISTEKYLHVIEYKI